MKAREVLALNVRKRRKEKGYRSSRAFAEDARLTPIMMARIEAGMGLPGEANLRHLAKKLGCEESQLFKDPTDLPTMEEIILVLRARLEALERVPDDILAGLSKVKDWRGVRAAVRKAKKVKT